MIRGNRRPWERWGDEGRAVSATYPLTVISAHRGWFDWRLSQLWRCRDLIALLVRRDFVSLYKQTILGPTWHVPARTHEGRSGVNRQLSIGS